MIPTGFLQGLTAQFRPESAQIQRATETSTGDGTSASWATIATVSARLSPVGGAQTETLGGAGRHDTMTIDLKVGGQVAKSVVIEGYDLAVKGGWTPGGLTG